MNEQVFFVETVFGAKTREPLIRISFDGKELCLIPAEDATSLAMNLLQAIQASLADAFLFSFMEKHVGAEPYAAAQVLAEFRQWREGRELKP